MALKSDIDIQRLEAQIYEYQPNLKYCTETKKKKIRHKLKHQLRFKRPGIHLERYPVSQLMVNISRNIQKCKDFIIETSNDAYEAFQRTHQMCAASSSPSTQQMSETYSSDDDSEYHAFVGLNAKRVEITHDTDDMMVLRKSRKRQFVDNRQRSSNCSSASTPTSSRRSTRSSHQSVKMLCHDSKKVVCFYLPIIAEDKNLTVKIPYETINVGERIDNVIGNGLKKQQILERDQQQQCFSSTSEQEDSFPHFVSEALAEPDSIETLQATKALENINNDVDDNYNTNVVGTVQQPAKDNNNKKKTTKKRAAKVENSPKPPKKRGRKLGSKNGSRVRKSIISPEPEKSNLAKYVELFGNDCVEIVTMAPTSTAASSTMSHQIVTSTTQSYEEPDQQTAQITYLLNGEWANAGTCQLVPSANIGNIISLDDAHLIQDDINLNTPFEDFVNYIDSSNNDNHNEIARVLEGTRVLECTDSHTIDAETNVIMQLGAAGNISDQSRNPTISKLPPPAHSNCDTAYDLSRSFDECAPLDLTVKRQNIMTYDFVADNVEDNPQQHIDDEVQYDSGIADNQTSAEIEDSDDNFIRRLVESSGLNSTNTVENEDLQDDAILEVNESFRAALDMPLLDNDEISQKSNNTDTYTDRLLEESSANATEIYRSSDVNNLSSSTQEPHFYSENIVNDIEKCENPDVHNLVTPIHMTTPNHQSENNSGIYADFTNNKGFDTAAAAIETNSILNLFSYPGENNNEVNFDTELVSQTVVAECSIDCRDLDINGSAENSSITSSLIVQPSLNSGNEEEFNSGDLNVSNQVSNDKKFNYLSDNEEENDDKVFEPTFIDTNNKQDVDIVEIQKELDPTETEANATYLNDLINQSAVSRAEVNEETTFEEIGIIEKIQNMQQDDNQIQEDADFNADLNQTVTRTTIEKIWTLDSPIQTIQQDVIQIQEDADLCVDLSHSVTSQIVVDEKTIIEELVIIYSPIKSTQQDEIQTIESTLPNTITELDSDEIQTKADSLPDTIEYDSEKDLASQTEECMESKATESSLLITTELDSEQHLTSQIQTEECMESKVTESSLLNFTPEQHLSSQIQTEEYMESKATESSLLNVTTELDSEQHLTSQIQTEEYIESKATGSSLSNATTECNSEQGDSVEIQAKEDTLPETIECDSEKDLLSQTEEYMEPKAAESSLPNVTTELDSEQHLTSQIQIQEFIEQKETDCSSSNASTKFNSEQDDSVEIQTKADTLRETIECDSEQDLSSQTEKFMEPKATESSLQNVNTTQHSTSQIQTEECIESKAIESSLSNATTECNSEQDVSVEIQTKADTLPETIKCDSEQDLSSQTEEFMEPKATESQIRTEDCIESKAMQSSLSNATTECNSEQDDSVEIQTKTDSLPETKECDSEQDLTNRTEECLEPKATESSLLNVTTEHYSVQNSASQIQTEDCIESKATQSSLSNPTTECSSEDDLVEIQTKVDKLPETIECESQQVLPYNLRSQKINFIPKIIIKACKKTHDGTAEYIIKNSEIQEKADQKYDNIIDNKDNKNKMTSTDIFQKSIEPPIDDIVMPNDYIQKQVPSAKPEMENTDNNITKIYKSDITVMDDNATCPLQSVQEEALNNIPTTTTNTKQIDDSHESSSNDSKANDSFENINNKESKGIICLSTSKCVNKTIKPTPKLPVISIIEIDSFDSSNEDDDEFIRRTLKLYSKKEESANLHDKTSDKPIEMSVNAVDSTESNNNTNKNTDTNAAPLMMDIDQKSEPDIDNEKLKPSQNMLKEKHEAIDLTIDDSTIDNSNDSLHKDVATEDENEPMQTIDVSAETTSTLESSSSSDSLHKDVATEDESESMQIEKSENTTAYNFKDKNEPTFENNAQKSEFVTEVNLVNREYNNCIENLNVSESELKNAKVVSCENKSNDNNDELTEEHEDSNNAPSEEFEASKSSKSFVSMIINKESTLSTALAETKVSDDKNESNSLNALLLSNLSVLEMESQLDETYLDFESQLDDDALSLSTSCFNSPDDDRFVPEEETHVDKSSKKEVKVFDSIVWPKIAGLPCAEAKSTEYSSVLKKFKIPKVLDNNSTAEKISRTNSSEVQVDLHQTQAAVPTKQPPPLLPPLMPKSTENTSFTKKIGLEKLTRTVQNVCAVPPLSLQQPPPLFPVPNFNIYASQRNQDLFPMPSTSMNPINLPFELMRDQRIGGCELFPREMFNHPPPPVAAANCNNMSRGQFAGRGGEAINSGAGELEIAKIFGITCLPFLVNNCSNISDAHQHSHQLHDASLVKIALGALSKTELNLAYRFMFNNKKLFCSYFCVFCSVYGSQNNRTKLLNMIHNCEAYAECVIFFREIFHSLVECGLNKVNACKLILSRSRDLSPTTIDILVSIIFETDWSIFYDYLERYAQLPEYKFRISILNEMVPMVLRTNDTRLIKAITKCIESINPEDWTLIEQYPNLKVYMSLIQDMLQKNTYI